MSGPLEDSDVVDGAGVAWFVALVAVLPLGSEGWTVDPAVEVISNDTGGLLVETSAETEAIVGFGCFDVVS